MQKESEFRGIPTLFQVFTNGIGHGKMTPKFFLTQKTAFFV